MAPYFLRNLVPRREKVERTKPLWEVLKTLTWTQWGLFISGSVVSLTALKAAEFDPDFRRWLAWTCDAIDFFTVSLTIVNLQKQFGRSTHDIVSDTSTNLSLHFF